MKDQLHRAVIPLAWLALPLTWLQYHAVWDRLPAHVATHFNAAGQANGWMTRDTALVFPLVLAALLLTVFTVILVRVRNQGPEFWALTGLLYVLLAVLAYANSSIIDYNLNGAAIQMAPVLIAVFAGVFVVLAIFLSARRGASLPAHVVIAEEVHAARGWAIIFVVPLFAELVVLWTVPNPGVRFAMGLASLLFLLIAAATWDGFHYVFTSAGVEIRTLSFRLRSIPATHIKSYAAERWNPLRGYGIRGVGNSRAYVWGNNVVRIQTTDGEVFLGHNEPQRIIRDLDAIKQFSGTTQKPAFSPALREGSEL